MICSNAEIYYTEYGDVETGQDTDGDGLIDSEEILIEYGKTHIPYVNSANAEYISAVYILLIALTQSVRIRMGMGLLMEMILIRL